MSHFPHAIGPYPAAPDWDDGPDELADAAQCPCGGNPIFHVARRGGDTNHIRCENPRCGRIVPAEQRTVAEAVTRWNSEIAQEAREDNCERHDWFANLNLPPGHYSCCHCGKEMKI